MQEAAVERTQGAQRGLTIRKEERREQTRDNADISPTVLQRQTRTHKETVDYPTGITNGKEARYTKTTYHFNYTQDEQDLPKKKKDNDQTQRKREKVKRKQVELV